MQAWWIVIVIVIVAAILLLRGRGANPSTVRKNLSRGAMVIDVRTPDEYASGHYEGATNIPVSDLQGRLSEIGDRQKPIVVYCASGIRSAQAAKILVAAGFRDVTNAGTLGNLGQ